MRCSTAMLQKVTRPKTRSHSTDCLSVNIINVTWIDVVNSGFDVTFSVPGI